MWFYIRCGYEAERRSSFSSSRRDTWDVVVSTSADDGETFLLFLVMLAVSVSVVQHLYFAHFVRT